MLTISSSLTKIVLVTGARGFVGRPVVDAFRTAGWAVIGAVRHRADEDESLGFGAEATGGEGAFREVVAGGLGAETDWREALAGVDVVVHLAARVHQMRDRMADPLAEFRRVNVEGTRRLAEQAAEAGVKRFVFVSSIKVNGEGTSPGQAYCETEMPAPADPYGISKYEAEEALHEIGARTGLEVVILRPPLMVGHGVKGNLASLAEAIRRGWPLPFGAITENLRSLLHVRNLADAIVVCAEHSRAAGEVFLVSDGVPVSTAELARQIGKAVGRSPLLLPVPVALLRIAGRVTGKRAAMERLTGSLLINDSKIRRLLAWAPKFGPHNWEV